MRGRGSNRLIVAAVAALSAGTLTALADPVPPAERAIRADGMAALAAIEHRSAFDIDWDLAPLAKALVAIPQ